MTNMKRITVSLTDEIDAAVTELKKTDLYKKSSYSAVLRTLIELGISKCKTTSSGS